MFLSPPLLSVFVTTSSLGFLLLLLPYPCISVYLPPISVLALSISFALLFNKNMKTSIMTKFTKMKMKRVKKRERQKERN